MLDYETALITGSTSGIGLGIPEVFAAAAANVILNGFGDADEIEATRVRLAARHRATVRYDAADANDPAAIGAMIAAVLAEIGRIDSLVDNAGFQSTVP